MIKRLFTILLSIGMVLMCLPTAVDAVDLWDMTFVAENAVIYDDYGAHESPWTTFVSDGNTVGRYYIYAESNDPSMMFVGWAETEGGEAIYDQYEITDVHVSSSMKFYAVFSETYTLTLNANGGYFWGDVTREEVTFRIPKGERVGGNYTTPDTDDPNKAFVGWSFTKDGEAELERYISEFIPSGDTTLYAVWDKAFTVTLNANGGCYYEDESYTELNVKVIAGDSINNSGYSLPDYKDYEKALIGWSYTPDGPVEVARYLDLVPTGNITLYAVWGDAWKLTLKGNGGYFYTMHGQDDTYYIAVEKGKPVDQWVSAYHSDTSLAFAGWSLTESGDVDYTRDELANYVMSGPMTMYAVWKESVTLTLDGNGQGTVYGQKTYTQRFAKGSTVGSNFTATPYADDLAFVGWSFTPDGQADISRYDLYNFVLNESVTLYAVYEKGCKVILDGNGYGRFYGPYGLSEQLELMVPENQQVGGNYTPELVSADNLMFAGWSFTPDGDVDIERYDLYTYVVTQPVTLYAVWKEYYTLSLHANGGYYNHYDDPQIIQVVKGGMMDGYETPSHSDPHLTFGGWSRTPDGEMEYLNLYQYIPEADEDFYAVWEKAYSITFKTSEGYFLYWGDYGRVKSDTYTFKLVAGQNLYDPETYSDDPHRALVGWSLTEGGDVDYTINSIYSIIPEGDMTLYAVWSKGWTVTLDGNGGTFYDYETDKRVPTYQFTVADNALLADYGIRIPSNDNGLAFYSYSETPDGEYIDFGTYRVTSDVTLYAQWGEPFVYSDVWRIAGSGRFQTSMKIAEAYKEEKGIDKFDAVIISSGLNFADALAGSYLSYKKNAPILITADEFGDSKPYEEVNAYIKANLKAKGTVYVLGGTGAVSDTALTGLDGFDVKRLKGAGRFETNIEILKEAGVTNEEILVATGYNFADSLSASAVNRPILLVGDELNSDQLAYLDSLDTSKFYILGGTGAVKEAVETQLKEYGSVTRLAGKGRHETSVLIAETFCNDADAAVLAYSFNFPDGLCAGPLASALNGPLILTQTGTDSAAAAAGFCGNRGIEYGYVTGGTGLIDDDTVRWVFGLASETIIPKY